MRKWLIRIGIFAGLVLMSACGSKNLVVLVPDPDGSVGSFRVSNSAGSVTMDKAYQSTAILDSETAPGTPVRLDKSSVDKTFGKALQIQPEPPIHFIRLSKPFPISYFGWILPGGSRSSAHPSKNIVAALRN